MRLFYKGKDGGYESTVTGYWLCEFKRLFSIVLLRFDNGTREAYHSHAFNCISWVLKGALKEEHHSSGHIEMYSPSLWPVVTRRDTFHQVNSIGTTWVLSFRGPWTKTWNEFIPAAKEMVTLSNGRNKV